MNRFNVDITRPCIATIWLAIAWCVLVAFIARYFTLQQVVKNQINQNSPEAVAIRTQCRNLGMYLAVAPALVLGVTVSRFYPDGDGAFVGLVMGVLFLVLTFWGLVLDSAFVINSRKSAESFMHLGSSALPETEHENTKITSSTSLGSAARDVAPDKKRADLH